MLPMLPLPVGLYAAWRRPAARPILITLAAGLVMAAIHPFKDSRFIMPFYPLAYVLAAIGLAQVYAWTMRLRRLRWLLLTLLVLFTVTSVTRPVKNLTADFRAAYDAAAQCPGSQIQPAAQLVSRWSVQNQPTLLAGSFDALSPDLVRIIVWSGGGDPYRVLADEILASRPATLEQAAVSAAAETVVRITLQPGSPLADYDYKSHRASQAGIPPGDLLIEQRVSLDQLGMVLERYKLKPGT